MKAWGGRGETTARILEERRAPRERGRMGTSHAAQGRRASESLETDGRLRGDERERRDARLDGDRGGGQRERRVRGDPRRVVSVQRVRGDVGVGARGVDGRHHRARGDHDGAALEREPHDAARGVGDDGERHVVGGDGRDAVRRGRRADGPVKRRGRIERDLARETLRGGSSGGGDGARARRGSARRRRGREGQDDREQRARAKRGSPHRPGSHRGRVRARGSRSREARQ